MVHPDHQTALRPFLLPGERLLWAGRPKQGLLLRSADLYLVPFSLFFVGFVLVWNRSLWWMAPDLFFAAMGAAMVVFAAYAAVGRFALDAIIRATILYGVTNRRIVILRRTSFRALDLRYLPMLELEQGRARRGTISFDVPPDVSFWSSSRQPDWTPALVKTPRFLQIEDAATVYDLISREAERLRRESLAALPPDKAAFIG